MTEQELRDWLAKRMRVGRVPQSVWQALNEEDLISYVLGMGIEDAGGELLSVAQRYYKVWRSAKEQNPTPTRLVEDGGEVREYEEDFKPEPSVHEGERANAFSEYLAKLASDDPRARDGAV